MELKNIFKLRSDHRASRFLTGALCFAISILAYGKVMAEHKDVDGARVVDAWTYENCVELTNPSVRVVLCPIGGRVIEYSLSGKHSLQLDERDPGYQPGSERTMTAGRFDIGPEKIIPKRSQLWSGTWTAKIVGPRTAELTSPDDVATGSRLTRRFELAATGTHLKCTQTITNISEETTEWCHWSRTFALGNGIVVMPISEHSKFPNHYVMYEDGKRINIIPEDPAIRTRDGFLEVTDVPRKPKLGMDTKEGWIAYAMQNDLLFVKRFRVYPKRVYNEVAGLTVSIWYPEDRRVEVEPIGPRERLKPGESGSFTEEWWLEPFPFPNDRRIDLTAVEKVVNEKTTAPE